MTAFLPFMIAFLIGFLISKKWIKLTNSIAVLLLRMSIGMGLGIGILSLFTFLSLFIPDANKVFYTSKSINKLFFLIIAILILYLIINESKNIIKIGIEIRFSFSNIFITILFIMGLLIAFDRFWQISAENSHGGWDAWAIWNLHARFIYLSGDDWKNLFTNILVWSHVDYPLMTPSMIVFGWKILGNDSRLIPMILGGVYTFGSAAVLFATLLYLRNYSVAVFGTMVLVFSNPFIREGALQYADVPLAYYILCVISLTIIAEENRVNGEKISLLTGILLGFSAWTKNEGLIFILLYFIVMGFKDLINKSFDRRKWFGLSAELLPIGFVIGIFKTLATGNDILTSLNSHNFMNLLTDVNRYKEIFSNGFKYISEFNNGNINIFLLLLVLISIIGIENLKKLNKYLPVIGIIFLTFISYLFIYLITPKEISWHMQTSFTRLLIHLYPSLLLMIFIFIKDPFKLQKDII